MFTIPAEYVWLDPWHRLSADSPKIIAQFGNDYPEAPDTETIAKSLEDELRRELPAGHPLSGLEVKVVGFCSDDPNEFLFVTSCRDYPIACVHLTWRKERHPLWPHTDRYTSLLDWTAQMKREHDGAIRRRTEQSGGSNL